MKYIVGALVFVVLIAAGFFVSQNKKDDAEIEQQNAAQSVSAVQATRSTHNIVLTPDGHEPSEITIKLGDEVTFSADTTYDKLHWPASNIHPTHSVYSEFDPEAPIEADEEWSFIFEKAGEWKFHDHLAPYHTGTIFVEE